MYVQARDRKFYENPLILGEDGNCYIRQYDLETPEIVIKYSPTTTKVSARRMVYKRFKELEMKVKVHGESDPSDGEEGLFPFPPLWDDLVRGAKWYFEFKGPIAIPTSYDTKVDQPRSDSKFIGWSLEFGLRDVMDILDKNKFHPLIYAFILGHEPLEQFVTGNERRKVKKVLAEQLSVDDGRNDKEKETLTIFLD